MLPRSSIPGRKLEVLLLASEWGSSQGGLSTMNREMAIYLAKHPEVKVSFLVPKCSEEEKRRASDHNVTLIEAQRRPGYEPIDCLSFPPRDLVVDIIIGHGVKLGKQAQVIRETHNCTWVQVVHTAPEELAMFKTYSGAIARGEEKHLTEVELCEMADLVVAVGPKLFEVYSAYLSSCGKTVFKLTPGIFTELSSLKQHSSQKGSKFRVLVFGRGDSEDFELKGFDIAAQAVSALSDRSYHLIFVGAPSGREEQVAETIVKQGLLRSQLTVRKYLENREKLAKLFCEVNLAIIPSRTEGFGLTALEALSACLPFLVSRNSGFGEALANVPNGLSCVVDSEDPEHWAEAIKHVRAKNSETRLKEYQAVRRHYDGMYSWEEQCEKLVERMLSIAQEKSKVALEGMLKDKMSLTPSYEQSKEMQSSERRPDSLTEQMKAESKKRELVAIKTQKHQPTGVAIPDEWQRIIPFGETLLLKTCILDGKVSLDPNHVEYRRSNWRVPRYIVKNVEREYNLTQYGDLFFTSDESGKLRHRVDVPIPSEEATTSGLVDFESEDRLVFAGMTARGKQRQKGHFEMPKEWRGLLAPNETLMLKTRISYGKVSLDANDIEYRQRNWTIPQYKIESIQRETRDTFSGELFIISDANGQLRHVVNKHIVFCARFLPED